MVNSFLSKILKFRAHYLILSSLLLSKKQIKNIVKYIERLGKKRILVDRNALKSTPQVDEAGNVTSYEYADIHQLTGYWFDYFSDLKDFRQQFIGTSYSTHEKKDIRSFLGQKIINELEKKSSKIAKDVSVYFNDMDLVAKEMYRVLQPKGTACVVIGNTKVKDVDIKSAEVFLDLLRYAGFKKKDVIKRSIPHKLMPTIRNTKNGKFAKVTDPDSKKVYPNEYIIVVKK